MASTPNLNPPVSSAAVHAAIFQAKAPRRGEKVVLQLSKISTRATGRVDRAPSHTATPNSLLMN